MLHKVLSIPGKALALLTGKQYTWLNFTGVTLFHPPVGALHR